MSGIVGFVNLDGAPADRELLCQLTRSIAFRGPDAQDVCIRGSAGLGHTMLRTTVEAQREQQPCTLGGDVWITADCRIDARQDLIRELGARGRPVPPNATDPELILHAYAAWGTDCLQHLIGDFAFAVWDGPNQLLFCARDHMGVKPLYYALKENCLIFGNTLNSLRLHPAVSSRLNDLAIADFLMFAFNMDRAGTSFRDIQRLLPGHWMLLKDGQLKTGQYWSVPVDPPLRYRRRQDYVDQFLLLLRTAVKDRMRIDSVSVLMSGGLDSTALAAIAKELADQSGATRISAYTMVFDRLFPDRERHYAGVAAAHLKIPVHFTPMDDYAFYESCFSAPAASPDPGLVFYKGPLPPDREYGMMASDATRVVFYGEGPDNALNYELKPWLAYERKQRNFGRLVRDIVAFPFLFGQIPFWGRLTGATPDRPPFGEQCFPPWLNPGLVARLGLRERYEQLREIHLAAPAVHPVRPAAHASFDSLLWQPLFESQDPGVTRVPVEVRHPFVDIRMLRFLLSLPVLPWCRDKYLLRRSLVSYLPKEIVTRPKTGLAAFPDFELWKERGVPDGIPLHFISDYVDVEVLARTTSNDPTAVYRNMRPLTLSFFLRNVDRECILGCT